MVTLNVWRQRLKQRYVRVWLRKFNNKKRVADIKSEERIVIVRFDKELYKISLQF